MKKVVTSRAVDTQLLREREGNRGGWGGAVGLGMNGDGGAIECLLALPTAPPIHVYIHSPHHHQH